MSKRLPRDSKGRFLRKSRSSYTKRTRVRRNPRKKR